MEAREGNLPAKFISGPMCGRMEVTRGQPFVKFAEAPSMMPMEALLDVVSEKIAFKTHLYQLTGLDNTTGQNIYTYAGEE